MKYIVFSILLLIGILLEVTVIQIPLVLLILLVGFILFQDEWLFFAGLIAGLLLDALRLQTIGMTSLYYITVLLLIFLYKRRFEIKTVPFVFFASILCSFFYLLLFGSQSILLQSLVSGIFGIGGFTLFKKTAVLY